jgi:hypothetical protein
VRKRCVYCKKLFYPDPRQKGKQKTCGSEACKKKRKREYGKAWRERNPEYDTGEYRQARRQDRRAWKRQYWSTHPRYRLWHLAYVRIWRQVKKLPDNGVKVPNPEIELNYCKRSTYLEITRVKVPYPEIAPILFGKKDLSSFYSGEGRKSR